MTGYYKQGSSSWHSKRLNDETALELQHLSLLICNASPFLSFYNSFVELWSANRWRYSLSLFYMHNEGTWNRKELKETMEMRSKTWAGWLLILLILLYWPMILLFFSCSRGAAHRLSLAGKLHAGLRGPELSLGKESFCLFHYFLLYQRAHIHWKWLMACGWGVFVLHYHSS